MTAFTALPPDQQGQILAFMSAIRPSIGLLARTRNAFAQMDTAWITTVLAEITALDAGAIIPDPTGLAGAAPLTREDVLNAMSSVEAFLLANNTTARRAAYIRIAGITNTIGS